MAYKLCFKLATPNPFDQEEVCIWLPHLIRHRFPWEPEDPRWEGIGPGLGPDDRREFGVLEAIATIDALSAVLPERLGADVRAGVERQMGAVAEAIAPAARIERVQARAVATA